MCNGYLDMTSVISSSELLFAVEACKAAGDIAMDYLRKGVSTETKLDGSVVTKADKESERLIIDRIKQAYPDDGILGEEHGEKKSTRGGRRWIIDPIDGTFNYARGIPIFSTLLALEYEQELVLGVVHAPAMLETFWAERGKGAFKNGMPMRVSSCADIGDALLNFGGANRILDHGYWEGFRKLVSETRTQRGFGDYLGFSLVFEGKAEAMIEIAVKPWDLAPMKILVEESGGRFSDLAGGKSIYSGSCLISNGLVHDHIESALRDYKS